MRTKKAEIPKASFFAGRPYDPKNHSFLPRPLHDRVLVKRIPEAEPEEGAIIAPEIARKKPLEAIVLAVGPGRQREDEWGSSYFQPTQVKAGQKVLISPGVDAGNWSDLAEDALGGMLMIMESDVMGVID